MYEIIYILFACKCESLSNKLNYFTLYCIGYRCEVYGSYLHWTGQVWSMGMF